MQILIFSLCLRGIADALQHTTATTTSPEVTKLILLRLCIGELGLSAFDAQRLDEDSSMDGARIHLIRMWGTGEWPSPAWNSRRFPLSTRAQRYPTEEATVGSLKNASLIEVRVCVERTMEKPRIFVYAETQQEVALMTEETGLLEEPPYEWLSASEHQCDDQFATCCVSVTYS